MTGSQMARLFLNHHIRDLCQVDPRSVLIRTLDADDDRQQRSAKSTKYSSTSKCPRLRAEF